VLEDHFIIYPRLKKNKYLKPSLIIFAVVTLFYILTLSPLLDIDFNFILYFIIFVFLVAFPLSKVTDYKKEVLIITPELLIQRVEKNKFSVVSFDMIDKFEFEEDQLVIHQKDEKIIIGISKYESNVTGIIDILEAKGKTFDKKKEFMIRPVNIIVTSSSFRIEEIEVPITETETLTSTLMKKYPYITPGFIEDIIPKNAIIYKAYSKKRDLYIELSHLEVKSEHPENTTFDSIEVTDCIFVFEDFKISDDSLKNDNERSTPYVDISASETKFKQDIKDGVISEWKYSKDKIDFTFAVGIKSLKATISYKDVMVGWKQEK